MSQIPEHLGDVEEGWHPLLMDLHAKLVALAPLYKVGQVKEKFATLRVYLDRLDDGGYEDYPPEVWELIDEAEEASGDICETCGKPGTLDDSHFWIKTRCEECR